MAVESTRSRSRTASKADTSSGSRRSWVSPTELAAALNDEVIVTVVGPVCAEALQSAGVAPDIIPARATMDAMIAALAEYVELTEGLGTRTRCEV